VSTGALKSLTVQNLRGSVTPFSLTFEKGKKLTIVYGENATGKSTICDAFDFIGRGVVGSLDGRGLGTTASYWPSIGKNASEISVTIDTSDGECCATAVKGEVVVLPAAKRPRVAVLRRAQLVELLEATAAKRYEAVQHFIDVSHIENAEAALRSAIKDLRFGRDSAVTRIDENQKIIGSFWQTAGAIGGSPLSWAEQAAGSNPGDIDAKIDALGDVRTLYTRISETAGKFASAATDARTAHDVAAAAGVRLEELSGAVAADSLTIMAILQAAQQHLDGQHDPKVCPLCESADKVEGLVARVDRRLETLSALRTASADATSKRNGAIRADDRLAAIRTEALEYATDFDTGMKNIFWPASVPLPLAAPSADPTLWPAWLKETDDLSDKWRAAEVGLQDHKKFLTTLKAALATLLENLTIQQELDALLPKMERALAIVEQERRKFTDAVLTKIAEDVGILYEGVHPGEGLDKISLELDPKRRASLAIGASFCGSDNIPPQAYFSDSHLDTLGLCIFLALAAHDSVGETILVLDDVVASMDEPHVDRLIELLYRETTKFRHCIVTTHYKPWKEKYRWGQLRSGDCHFVELTKWSASDGMKLIRSMPELERLRTMLEDPSPDLQGIVAKAAVILEAALDFLTLLYGCHIPRKAVGGYTIGELLPAVDRKLRKALMIEIQSVDGDGSSTYIAHLLESRLDELDSIMQLRNIVGAHYNEASFSLPDADALRFGTQVLQFVELLTDETVGWPKNGKSGQYWATSGETRRLHPLKRPS
jgi:energy-coupling factor transporter ATP-binding protein EcfA2